MNVNRLIRMGTRYVLPLVAGFIAKKAAANKSPEEAKETEAKTKKTINQGIKAARTIRRLR